MPDFNIDDMLSKFGEKSKPATSGNFDVDSVLSEFGVKASEPEKGRTRAIIQTPKPPISGISKEDSDTFNQTVESKQGGDNPRSLLPRTNVGESIAGNFNSGKELIGSGLEDLNSGHPYKGAAKVAGGSLAALASPLTGTLEGGVATPVTDITGNKDIGDRAAFVAGSAIPLDMGASKVIKALPKNKALSTLVENIGPENLPAVVSAMKANHRLAPADLSPRVLQDTQHLFANDGPQIDYLAKTSGARIAGSKDAITSAYDASAGTPVNVVQKLNNLATEAKKIGTEKINPAVKGAGPVDVSNTVTAIDKILKPGVNSVISGESSLPLTAVKKELAQIKTMLVNDTEMRTGAADLHSFQAGLRRTAEGLLKSASGADREMGGALMNVRNNLVSDIDKATPRAKATTDEILKQKGFSDKQIEELGTGKLRDKTIEIFEKANGGPILSKDRGTYKESLASYRDEMHIADSFRDGYEGIFSNSKKMENRPEFTEQWFKGLTDQEKEAAREGARTAIHTEIGVAKNGALSGTNLAKSDFNKEKLEIIFGKEEASTLIKKLEAERAIANTHNKIVEGSQTAMRTASKSQFALPDKTEVMKSAPAVAASEAANFFMGGIPGVATGVLATAKLGAKVKDAVAMKLAREHNARYATYALPTEGPSRDELIRQLEARIPGPKQSLVRRGAGSLARLVQP